MFQRCPEDAASALVTRQHCVCTGQWPAVLQMKIFQVIPKSLYTYIPDHRHIVSVKQGWGFALSAFRSKSLILQSDREQFAHVALYKRVNCSCRSLKKSNVCDLLVIGMFLTVFPLFMPKRESLTMLFAHLLFFKELL